MRYAILLYGDEQTWATADDVTRTAVYADHEEFARLCAERGHTITGGAELALSTASRIVRGTTDDFSVTDGPYAETAEQLGGFIIVETDDLDDLCRLVAMLSGGEPMEIRPFAASEL